MFRHTRHKGWAILTAVCTMAVMCGTGGCGRAISEGFHGITGSSGRVTLIKGDPAEISTLAQRYGGVEILAFGNDVGGVCPPEVLTSLPGAVKEQLRYRPRTFKERIKFKKAQDTGPFFTGPADKKLLIKGTIIQYDAARTDTKGIIEKAAGPVDEAICRIKIFDAQTHKFIAEGNCTGRSKSVVRTGPGELARGIAKAIRKWLTPAKKK